MNLSAIIPSRTASNVIPCVAAVREHEPEARVTVVWDRSKGNGPAPEVDAEVIEEHRDFIFARSVNAGIKAAGESDVVLLNDDALLQTPLGFSQMAAFAAEHLECGAVVPSTNITGQPLQWPRNVTGEGFRYCQNVPYVCVYIPRSTLNTVGLLDERYCLDYGCEDRDHCEAMDRAGLKVAILYTVYVDHGSLRSSFRGDPRAAGDFSRNYELFKAKWGVA